MEKMDYRGASQPRFPTPRRSGYEPSDTETEWQDSHWKERNRNFNDLGLKNTDLGLDGIRNKSPLKPNKRYISLDQTRKKSPLKQVSRNEEPRFKKADLGLDQARNKSPLKLNRRQSAKFEDDLSSRTTSKTSPPKRRHSKSPYKPTREDTPSRNISPFITHVSPYKSVREGYDLANKGAINSKRLDTKLNNKVEKSNYNHSHRSQSAPRPRYSYTEENRQRTPSPLPRIQERETDHKNSLSVGELNEQVANAKTYRVPTTGALNFESTESISQGDIFFSMQNKVIPKKDNKRNHAPRQRNEENGNRVYNNKKKSYAKVTTHTIKISDSDKLGTTTSSKLSVSSANTAKFVANRKKSQAEPWFSCLKSGTCRKTKSPEKVKEFDEASFIEKAFVAESLRQFWADKYQPASLDGFTCHKQEAQSLKQLVSNDTCPHILLKGPRGSGKKTLTMALLREIFGDSTRNISHELRSFRIQGNRPTKVVVLIPSSPHHVELNAYTEPHIKYALISLVKEISENFALTPEISIASVRTDYKVIVLYDVGKALERVQHLIKWIMDCYTESCKLVLCCEDDVAILEPVKSRCHIVKVDAPGTHEIVEVLIQIAKKEDFDLPINFASKIAKKSRQNLRQAIMALEACKAHKYPFVDEQPIPIGWEEVVEDLAAEILADPSHTRIFSIRGRFQKLLVEFVHPKLILQGLVEQFLKTVQGKSKRELYYWHAYYEKRLPIGTSALLKLEEFVAKFMGMHRRGNIINRNIAGLTG